MIPHAPLAFAHLSPAWLSPGLPSLSVRIPGRLHRNSTASLPSFLRKKKAPARAISLRSKRPCFRLDMDYIHTNDQPPPTHAHRLATALRCARYVHSCLSALRALSTRNPQSIHSPYACHAPHILGFPPTNSATAKNWLERRLYPPSVIPNAPSQTIDQNKTGQ